MPTSENEINNLIVSAIRGRLQTVLLMLINNCYELSSKVESILPPHTEKPVQFINLEKTLFSITIDLDKIIKESEDSEAAVKDARNLKLEILSLASTLFAYYESAESILSLITLELPETSENFTDESVDIEMFLHDCYAYISANADSDEEAALQRGRMNRLLKYVPIRMTKEKYYDYLRSVIKGLFADTDDEAETRNTLSFLKLLYLPTSAVAENPEDFCSDYRKLFEELFAEDFSSKSLSEIDETSETLRIIEENINVLLDYLAILYESANFIHMLSIIANDLDYVFDGNVLFKDFYFTLKNNLFQDELELYKEASSEQLLDSIEKSLDSTAAFETKLAKKLNSADISTFSEEFEIVSNILQITNELYYDDLNNHLPYFSPTNEAFTQDKNGADYVSNSLINFIQNEQAKFSLKRQKQLRQLFLEKIPCSLSPEELINYMRYAFSSCDEAKRRACIVQICNELDISSHNHNGHTHDEHCHDEHCGHHH